jgi:predicted kinase
VDASVTTALATLLGAATGGLTSVLATWLAHRTQARAQWLEQDTLRKQDPARSTLFANSVRPVAQNSRRCELRDVARECALTGSYVCFWHEADIALALSYVRFR